MTQAYSQQVSFSYRGRARPGPVYPAGIVATGDPIYVQLVHRVTLTVAYGLTSAAPHQVHGTIRVRGTLSNATGWSRVFWLGPPVRFAGNRADATAVINLTRLEALTTRIDAQLGTSGSFSLAVVPQVTATGQMAGQPLSTDYNPTLRLTLGAPEFLSGTSAITPPAGASSASAATQRGLNQRVTGIVRSWRTTVDRLAGVPIKIVRAIALVALAIFTLIAFAMLIGDADPTERINRRYRHLIVPVTRMPPSRGRPPIDVSSIDALARLAERSGRLILHDQREDVDNYLIIDQGTRFRFRARRPVATKEEEPAGTNGARAAGGHGPTVAGEDGTTAGGGNGIAAAGNGTAAAAGNRAAAAADNRAAASVANGSAAAVGNGTPAGDEPPGGTDDPPPREPAVDAAAALLSSAAAKLRAAADQAGHANPTESDGHNTPRPSSPPTAAVVLRSQARRPPITAESHWSTRVEVRAGFALGPLALAFLAWRRLRARRERRRSEAYEEPRSSARAWTARNLARTEPWWPGHWQRSR